MQLTEKERLMVVGKREDLKNYRGEHDHEFKGSTIEHSGADSGLISRTMVGLPGFEPESIEPKSTSLDQASRQPQTVAGKDNFFCIIKTLAKP